MSTPVRCACGTMLGSEEGGICYRCQQYEPLQPVGASTPKPHPQPNGRYLTPEEIAAAVRVKTNDMGSILQFLYQLEPSTTYLLIPVESVEGVKNN
jgi:hypothetical protein